MEPISPNPILMVHLLEHIQNYGVRIAIRLQLKITSIVTAREQSMWTRRSCLTLAILINQIIDLNQLQVSISISPFRFSKWIFSTSNVLWSLIQVWNIH